MVVEFKTETNTKTGAATVEQLATWTQTRAEEYITSSSEVSDPRAVHVSFATKALASNKASFADLETDQLEHLVYDIADLAMGHKLLTKVRELARKGASDIFVKGTDAVVIHYRSGQREAVDPWYSSLKGLGDEIRNLRSSLGIASTPFDPHNPSFDARLPEGIRVNAAHSANSGYELSFRVPDRSIRSLADLKANNTVDTPLADFLSAAVRAQLNIVISGGTGAGKTALLLCMLGELEPLERVVTIEDRAELDLATLHPKLDVVELEGRGANSDGVGEVTGKQLMKSALRMHPDRIVVGEARDEIARELLTAMASGNDGSLSTLHARSPSAVIDRLVECSGLDYARVTESIRNAVDLFVHVRQFSNGERRVSDVVQVSAARELDGLLRLKPIYAFNPKGAPQSTYAQLVAKPSGRVASRLAAAGWKP